MKQLTIAICFILLSSCQSYRAERKIGWLKQKGYLSDSVITKYDTIKGYHLDTIIQFDSVHHTDTLFTYQNGLKVTTIVRWKERQVRQIINQKDTIFEHKYTTKVIKEPKKWWEKYERTFWVLLLILTFGVLTLKLTNK